jgi:hypothetical protein
MTTADKKQVKQEEQDDETYQKLSDLFVKFEDVSKIEIRNATYGHTRTDYVRGKNLEKALTDNIEILATGINKILNLKIDPASPSALHSVYKELHDWDILSRAERPKTEGKIKFPKRLIPLEESDYCCDDDEVKGKKSKIDFASFDPTYFYAINVIRSQKKTYFWLFVAIFGVIMACLFPVWPIEVKIGIWWVSYILLIAIVVLIIIRYLVYSLFFIFGISFWIFPNFFDDSRGVIDSFIPIYSVEKRKDSLISILIRIAIAGTVGYIAWYAYTNPDSLFDLRDHLLEVYNDMFEFGKDKIVNYYVRLIYLKFLIKILEFNCLTCQR